MSSASRKQSVAVVFLGLALGLLLAWAFDKSRTSGSVHLETKRVVKRLVRNANTTNLRSHVLEDYNSQSNRNSSADEVKEIAVDGSSSDPPRSCKVSIFNYACLQALLH